LIFFLLKKILKIAKGHISNITNGVDYAAILADEEVRGLAGNKVWRRY